MTTYAKAVERFKKLERVCSFPRRCEYCSETLTAMDNLSVIERAGIRPAVMHADCARRYRGIRR